MHGASQIVVKMEPHDWIMELHDLGVCTFGIPYRTKWKQKNPQKYLSTTFMYCFCFQPVLVNKYCMAICAMTDIQIYKVLYNGETINGTVFYVQEIVFP